MVDRDWYITEGIDEQKVLDDVREQSKKEVVQVHWHRRDQSCEAKFAHALYKDGYAPAVGGCGKA